MERWTRTLGHRQARVRTRRCSCHSPSRRPQWLRRFEHSLQTSIGMLRRRCITVLAEFPAPAVCDCLGVEPTAQNGRVGLSVDQTGVVCMALGITDAKSQVEATVAERARHETPTRWATLARSRTWSRHSRGSTRPLPDRLLQNARDAWLQGTSRPDGLLRIRLTAEPTLIVCNEASRSLPTSCCTRSRSSVSRRRSPARESVTKGSGSRRFSS